MKMCIGQAGSLWKPGHGCKPEVRV
jgi:hypothetical protein